MALGHLDLICPNDSCPGGFGPQGGPYRRHRWTARGPLYHNMIQLPDGATRCSECNSDGVEPGAVTEFLPEEETPMDMITRTIQFGPHVRVELHWPAELATVLPDIEIDLHHPRERGAVSAADVVAALGGASAFDPVDTNYLTITGQGNDDCDHSFTYWPVNDTASKLPTNEVARAVREEQLAAGIEPTDA